MIRAVYRDGRIEPAEAIPRNWHEGDELVVDALPSASIPDESFEEWVAEMEEATAQISDEDHALMEAALKEIEARSKEQGRRESERLSRLFDDKPGDEAARRAS